MDTHPVGLHLVRTGVHLQLPSHRADERVTERVGRVTTPRGTQLWCVARTITDGDVVTERLSVLIEDSDYVVAERRSAACGDALHATELDVPLDALVAMRRAPARRTTEDLITALEAVGYVRTPMSCAGQKGLPCAALVHDDGRMRTGFVVDGGIEFGASVVRPLGHGLAITAR